MVATDHDGSLHLTRADELVDRKPRPRAIAVAEPADAGRQALEGDPLRRECEPALQELVAGKELAQCIVDHGDVGRVTGQRCPAKRPDPATEERPDIGRDEARV